MTTKNKNVEHILFCILPLYELEMHLMNITHVMSYIFYTGLVFYIGC